MIDLCKEFFKRNLWLLVVVVTAGVAFAQFEPKGYSDYAKGDYEKALEAFRDREIDHPQDLRNVYNRAMVQYRLKQFAEAKEGFARSAKSSDSELAQKSQFNLANTQALAGEIDEAIKSYEEVLRRNPNHRQAQENLAAVKKWKEEQPPQQQNSQDQTKKDEQQRQQSPESSQETQENQQQQDDAHQTKPDASSEQKQSPAKQEQATPNKNGQQDDVKEGATAMSEKNEGRAGEETAKEAQAVPLDKEQAEALLKGVDDNAKKFLYRNRDKGQRSVPAKTDKDW